MLRLPLIDLSSPLDTPFEMTVSRFSFDWASFTPEASRFEFDSPVYEPVKVSESHFPAQSMEPASLPDTSSVMDHIQLPTDWIHTIDKNASWGPTELPIPLDKTELSTNFDEQPPQLPPISKLLFGVVETPQCNMDNGHVTPQDGAVVLLHDGLTLII